MSWTAVATGIVFSLYIGNAVGIYSLCVETPRLNKAKKYALYVPAFTVICIVYGILCGNKDRRKTMIKFLRVPHKNIIMLFFFADVIEVEREKRPQKVPKKKVVFDAVARQLPNIILGNRSFYY